MVLCNSGYNWEDRGWDVKWLSQGLAPAIGPLQGILTGSPIWGEWATCACSSRSQAPSVWPHAVVRGTDGKISTEMPALFSWQTDAVILSFLLIMVVTKLLIVLSGGMELIIPFFLWRLREKRKSLLLHSAPPFPLESGRVPLRFLVCF